MDLELKARSFIGQMGKGRDLEMKLFLGFAKEINSRGEKQCICWGGGKSLKDSFPFLWLFFFPYLYLSIMHVTYACFGMTFFFFSLGCVWHWLKMAFFFFLLGLFFCYHSTYFCYYSWVSLHFLILFMDVTILF